MTKLLQADVVEALVYGKHHHLETVRDFTANFVFQERVDGRLYFESEVEVAFRQCPFSVNMHWVRNVDRVDRVIFVENRWIDPAQRPGERQLAICRPSGALTRAVVKSVRRPVRGADAREQGRRFIDEFGFARGIDALLRDVRASGSTLVCRGDSSHDGRPTWVLELELSDDHCGLDYASAVYHIDQEWLVPVKAVLYGDIGRTRLVARYQFHNVRMNAGCSGRDFDPSRYGM